jgi:adenine-specific DNA-methyltransferase
VSAFRKTLAELGCTIRVGPALGNEGAFVGTKAELDVEPRLLARYVGPQEILEGEIKWARRYILTMHDREGRLIALQNFPRLSEHLEDYKSELEERIIVYGGAPWYRPIDRVRLADWSSPKILLPEIAKIPRVAIDETGFIPSHGVYAIFAKEGDIGEVFKRLSDGGLHRALKRVAPRIKGGYFRCYRKILETIRV